MSSRVEEAVKRHDKGYNCCQAVACALAEELGYDEQLIFQAGEGFGAGMGGMQCTCGALSGAVMAAGMKNSRMNGETLTKGSTYLLSKQMANKFQEKNGSVICKELKGLESGKVLRSCQGCIEDAVQIAEEVLGLE